MYLTYDNGLADVPGGHVEYGESVNETLRRELQEELGYTLLGEPKLMGVFDDIRPAKPIHRVTIGFLFDLPEKVAFTWKEKDQVTFYWIRRDSVPAHQFHPTYIKDLLMQAANAPHN